MKHAVDSHRKRETPEPSQKGHYTFSFFDIGGTINGSQFKKLLAPITKLLTRLGKNVRK